jgi:tRNA A37 threonylcarbamoyladenosine biosynthesis protein TsaE
MDAYRMASTGEAEDLDIDLMLTKGPLVVEWPERIEPALPKDRLWVNLRWMTDEQRGMDFNAQGDRFQALLAGLRRVFGGI